MQSFAAVFMFVLVLFAATLCHAQEDPPGEGAFKGETRLSQDDKQGGTPVTRDGTSSYKGDAATRGQAAGPSAQAGPSGTMPRPTPQPMSGPAPKGGVLLGANTMWLIVLAVLIVPQALVSFFLAGAKGYDPLTWTMMSLVPLLGFFAMMYLVGVPNNSIEQRLDRLDEKIESMRRLDI